jgi:DNA-binding response OmpR family regulator
VPTILLVDPGDDFAEELRAAHCSVVQAQDVTQALAISAVFRPDGIVLGVTSRGHSSFLAAAMLRFDRATADVPLICLLDPDGNEEAALATGCAMALYRPVTAGDILEALNRLG